MQQFLDTLLTFQVADPEDARRRRLLNILLAGTFVSGFLGLMLIASYFLFFKTFLNQPGTEFILTTSIILMASSVIVYEVNRRSGTAAAFLFLTLLTLAVSFSDIPGEVANGRSLFVFTFPIVISSLIIFPAAGFIFAILSSLIIIWLASSASTAANAPAIIGFFMLALVSWLAARGLENALKELRITNANLDKLVLERTQALDQALARERVESGQRQAILNSIADGVVVFDKNGSSILGNPAIQGLLEIPEDQLLNRTFVDLIQSVDLSARDSSLLQAMVETKTEARNFRVQWGGKMLSVNASPVYDRENEEIGTVAVFRDVTREAEIERMKSSFIGIVSHELRTPLSAIIGLSEMIKEAVYGPVNNLQVMAIERILRNTRHMLSMVGDLLDQAQIEAGKMKILAKPFKPSELLKDVQDVMGPLVAEKGLNLTSEIDPQLPESFMGDQQRLQQVLINLVNNSVKFTEAGNICIRLFLADAGHWGLQVKDTGHGISEDGLKHIFEAFYQVDSTTTRRQGGFGLGLSIVKQLTILMNGDIHVESTPGSGSTFTIKLPLMGGNLKGTATMNNSAMIVEDDTDLAEIFAEALRAAGFDTQVVYDGAIAQQRIREVMPQILLLDLHLPHVDGSSLLKQIRADSALKDMVVIIATADASMGDLYRDMADITLIKPISFVQLRDLSIRLRSVHKAAG